MNQLIGDDWSYSQFFSFLEEKLVFLNFDGCTTVVILMKINSGCFLQIAILAMAHIDREDNGTEEIEMSNRYENV